MKKNSIQDLRDKGIVGNFGKNLAKYNYILKVRYEEGYFDEKNKSLDQELTYSSIYPRTKEDMQKNYKHCKIISVTQV